MAPHSLLVPGFLLLLVSQACSITLECGNKPADMYFVLDSSSSIHPDAFRQQLAFVNTVAASLHYGDVTRIGALTFSYDVRPQIALGQYTDLQAFTSAVNKIEQKIGGTDTDKAIKSMRTQGFQNARPGIPHIGIIITDGESSEPRLTLEEARLAKAAGITLFAVGVGRKVNYGELRGMASSAEYAFRVNNYRALDGIKEKLAIRTCKVTTKAPPTTTLPPTTTPLPVIEGCTGHLPLDVVFSIPEQAGVEETALYIDFIKQITLPAKIGPNKVQMGMAKQIYQPRPEIPLSDSTDGDAIREQLDGVKPRGDRLELVLRHMRETSLTEGQGARRGAVKVAILVEDNRLTSPAEVKSESIKAQAQGIHVIVIGVGARVQNSELEPVASKGSYYWRPSATDLQTNVELKINVEDLLCKGSKGELKVEDMLQIL